MKSCNYLFYFLFSDGKSFHTDLYRHYIFKIKCNMLSLKYQRYSASSLSLICSVFNMMNIIFNRLKEMLKCEEKLITHPVSQR